MLVNLAACPISIKNCNTSRASLPRILLLSRIISLWLIVGILLGFGGFSVLWCLLPLLCIILVADWCWITVILINVLLYCYRSVAPFFLPGFFWFSLSARIFFLFYGSYLSVGILFSFYRSYLFVKNCIVSDISSPQGEFPFPLLSSVIGRDLSIKNWFSSAISSPPLWLIILSINLLPISHSPLLSFMRWMCYFDLSVQPLPID